MEFGKYLYTLIYSCFLEMIELCTMAISVQFDFSKLSSHIVFLNIPIIHETSQVFLVRPKKP